MSTDKHQVDLIIKANNLSGKTVAEVTAAVDKLNVALDKQVIAANKGETSLSALKSSYKELEDAGKQLIGQQALIDRFKQVADSVEAAKNRAQQARTAYHALAEEQSYLSTVTKAQDKDLLRLSKSADAADKALASQQKTLQSLVNDLTKVGVATDNLNAAEAKLVTSAKQIAEAQARAGEAFENYEINLIRATAAQREAADAKAFQALHDQNARFVKDAEYVRFWAESLDKAETEQKRAAAASAALGAEVEQTRRIIAKAAADEAAAAKAFNDIHNQNAKFAKDAEYVRFWTESLEAAEKQERQLAEAAKASTKATEEQAKAAARVAAAQKIAAKEAAAAFANNPFVSGGRTTLSLLQRIRGELLAVAAAYVGLQGAISGVASVLNAAKTQQQVQSKLLVSNGNDAKLAGEEYQYLRTQAERLGLFLPDLAKTYSSFSIAARAANLNTEEMRFVFERVAEAGRVLNLDADDVKGIFNAITQMVSKGKVSAEELRGQLGDRLPGAIQFAAKQYQGGVKEFTKQLEKGNIEATNGVLNLARGLDEAFNKQLASTVNGLDAQENRFKTSLFEFRALIADSGLTTAYTRLITELTAFFRSGEGREFAVSIADAFKVLADALIFVVNNLDTFQALAEGIIALYLAKQIFNMSIATAAFVKNLIALNALLPIATLEMTALQRATLLAQKSFLVLAAFIAGWEVGTILSEKFELVRQAGISLVVGLDKIWIKIKYDALENFEEIKTSWGDVVAYMVNLATTRIRETLSLFGQLATAVGADTLAAKIKKAEDAITVEHSKAAQARVGILKDQMQKELALAEKVGLEMFQDASDAARKAKAEQDKLKASQTGGRTEDPGGNAAAYTVDPEKAKKEAAEKYASLLAQIEAVESQALKKQKDSIEAITAGIETQYLALFRKINESNVKGAEELQARLRAAVDTLKAEATEKYNEEQLKQLESIQKKFAEIANKLDKQSGGSLNDRFSTIDQTYKSLYTDIEALDVARQGNLREQLDILVEQLKVVEQQKFAQDAIARSQKELNDLVSARDARIKTTNDLMQASLISEQEARERIKTIIEEAQPGIDEYANSAREIAESFRGIASDASLEEAAAKIDLAAASANRFKVELYSARDANRDLAAGITDALSKSAEGFGKAIVGAESFADAVKGVGAAFLDFAANFLRKIAEMILQQIILNALQSSGTGGGISGIVSAAVAHEGGTVGPGLNRSRAVNPSWFSGAPKYHSGGIAGLSANEYPAILKKNEEVLTTDDPRNILNGGTSGGGQQTAAAQNISVINMLDSGDVVSEGAGTPSGTKAILNVIRANRKQVRSIVGS